MERARGKRAWPAIPAVAMLATGLGGCVNITAPDKPIEINLNIKISQEVVYKLDAKAKSTIEQNPGIF